MEFSSIQVSFPAPICDDFTTHADTCTVQLNYRVFNGKKRCDGCRLLRALNKGDELEGKELVELYSQ